MELSKEDWHNEAKVFKNIEFKWKILLKLIKDNDAKFTDGKIIGLEDNITYENLNINSRLNHFNLDQGIGN